MLSATAISQATPDSEDAEEHGEQEVFNDGQEHNVLSPDMKAPKPKRMVSRPPTIQIDMAVPLHASPSTPNLPLDNAFLSPPKHTFRSKPPSIPPRPSSAPPTSRTFDDQLQSPNTGQRGSFSPRSTGRQTSFTEGSIGGTLSLPPPPLCT